MKCSKKNNPRKAAAKEEKRRQWHKAVEVVREATKKALKTNEKNK